MCLITRACGVESRHFYGRLYVASHGWGEGAVVHTGGLHTAPIGDLPGRAMCVH